MWATGILAYELVVGRPPFEVNDEVQTATMIMFSNNVVYPPKHSALWADFVKVALEKKPHIRPTALQMLDHPWYAIAIIASICISRQYTCMHAVLVGGQHVPVSRIDDNLRACVTSVTIPSASLWQEVFAYVLHTAALTGSVLLALCSW